LATQANHPDSLLGSMNIPLSPVTLVPGENIPLPPFLLRKIVPGNLLEVFDKVYSINMMLCTCFQNIFLASFFNMPSSMNYNTMSNSRIPSVLEEF